MSIITKYTGKVIISGLALCLSMTNVFANTLSEIEVYQNNSGYGISLRTDSSTQVKKVVSSSDRMSVILKDVNVSENLNTVYNNVSNMDNITVQPLGKNDIKINFKGKGIANSTVSFASSGNVSAYPETKSIQLNNPVSSYAPVYSPETFAVEEEASQTANPQLNEILTQMHISREMLLTTKRYAKSFIVKSKSFAKSLLNGNMNMLTVFGVLLIAAILMFKPRKNSNSIRPSKNAVGLSKLNVESDRNTYSDAHIEREISRNRQLANNMNLQSSIRNNYGVKAYQQSQKNPYMNSMSAMNNSHSNGISGLSRRRPVSSPKVEPKSMNNIPASDVISQRKQQPAGTSVMPKLPKVSEEYVAKSAARAASAVSKPAIKPTLKQPVQSVPQNEVDSLKFLESITKIYENSGRTDLAKGLKDNLRKAQLSRTM